jgi:hypothetical protein
VLADGGASFLALAVESRTGNSTERRVLRSSSRHRLAWRVCSGMMLRERGVRVVRRSREDDEGDQIRSWPLGGVVGRRRMRRSDADRTCSTDVSNSDHRRGAR